MALWSCLVAEAPRFFSLRCLALPHARWTLSQNGYQGFKKETEESLRPFKTWSLERTRHFCQIVLVSLDSRVEKQTPRLDGRRGSVLDIAKVCRHRRVAHWGTLLRTIFLGGPVVRNPPAHSGDTGLIPGPGTKIPHAMGPPSP